MRLSTAIVRRSLLLAGVFSGAIALASPQLSAATIIDEWTSVKAPPPPTLQAVKVDPATPALLVLDLLKQSCNDQARPRCVASIPKVAKLLKGARDSKTTVIYSMFPGPVTSADVLAAVAPLPSEPFVRAGADKFISTDLEKILKDKGIKTVIVVGTAAHGAVLYTASHAAELGFDVIIPVDGMSAENDYIEQYVAWNMVHAPVVSAKVKLSAIDMVSF